MKLHQYTEYSFLTCAECYSCTGLRGKCVCQEDYAEDSALDEQGRPRGRSLLRAGRKGLCRAADAGEQGQPACRARCAALPSLLAGRE